jgi:lysophospholipase L1-like esterase
MGHRLLIIGDSITLGALEVRGVDILSRVDLTYVDHLRALRPDVSFLVDAAIHRTTTLAAKALPRLLDQHQPHSILFMLGGNDGDLDWRRFLLSSGQVTRSNVPVERFKENLRLLVQITAAANVQPILGDLPRQDLLQRGDYLSRTLNTPVTQFLIAGGGQAEADRRLELYRDAIRAIAAETGVFQANWGTCIDTLGPEAFGPDGVHPSAIAHEQIADAIDEALDCISEEDLTASQSL